MKQMIKRLLSSLMVITLSVSSLSTPTLAFDSDTNADVESISDDNASSEVDSYENIQECKTESIYENGRVTYNFNVTSSWNNGYNATIRVENNTDKDIDDWKFEMLYDGNITNIWNAVIVKKETGKYIIKNAGWNQDIISGSYIEFGFTVQGDHTECPSSYTMLNGITANNQAEYTISYIITNDWGNGFTGCIDITNNSESTIEDWILEFDGINNISNIWNGSITSHDNNHYIVKNSRYNQNITSGNTISIGFEVMDGNSEYDFSEFTLYSYSDNSQEEISIIVDTTPFIYNEATNWYTVNNKIDSLSGTLSGFDTIKSFEFQVKDFCDNIILQDNIEISEFFNIKDFGLSIGYNVLNITATTKSGNKVEESIAFFNMNPDNLNGTNIDLNDSDGDGLNNYYEAIFGTDINNVDTDGDQINDFQEITLSITNPTKADTDDNSINDGYEDSDNDDLNNLSEIKLGTNCIIYDTDGDGLSDGDEINIYGSDPLKMDTDGDTLSDGQDIKLSFDPTKKDTDANGISDADETVHQTLSEEINNTKHPGVLSVSISLDCNGYLGDNANILDVYDIDMRSSEVVGLIGSPVDITVDCSFKTADIEFKYDENALGETKEDNLAMMWYDEENDNYVILDSILDKDNNTLKYTTTHFSTYLIIDKEIWLDNMRMDMNYRNSGDVTYYDMALVIDVSGSMSGARFSTARIALKNFVDAMMDNDRAGLVKFNSYATRVLNLTNDKINLKNKINALTASGGTDANAGLLEGISVLESAESGKEKMIILVCDGDVYYNSTTVQSAIDNDITIHCINVINGSSTAMSRIASETGGIYYYAATTNDIAKVIEQLTGNTVSTVDATDSDGDGLYDVYEVNGMRLSNGQIVYTDPNNPDTDNDGISDYDAMGGAPVTENIYIDGNTFSCTLNHTKIYGKLSSEFIYVDGRLNSNGKTYDGEMNYLPVSNTYLMDKYVAGNSYTMFNENRSFNGAAGIHKLFSDKLLTVNESSLIGYATVDSLIYTGILLSTLDGTATNVFDTYIMGTGGDQSGWVDGYTRMTINAYSYVFSKISNPAYEHFHDNIIKTKKAVEGIMNEYNKDAYISISPDTVWCGSDYVDYTNFEIKDIFDVLFNIAAFGTFNSSDAGITAHCTYDPATETYTLEFNYYLIDFYDYSFLAVLQDQDALGIARSFELYGKVHLGYTWKKGDTKMVPIQYA